MNTALLLISSFIILTLIAIGYYLIIEKPRMLKKLKNNVIYLQRDGFDFILYKGKISEMVNDYNRYLADMDIVIYSKSIFIGFLDTNQTYLSLPAKAIQSVKYEPNKVIINCHKGVAGNNKIVLKGKTTKQLYLMSKKIDFISRRSKRITAI